MKKEDKEKKIEINEDKPAACDNAADSGEAIDNFEIDVSSLDEAEAKQMLEEVLAENKDILKERDEAQTSLEEKTAEALKFKDNWYRTAAEFENFKKRNEFTRKNAYDDGLKEAVVPLLSIGDSIDRALKVEMDDKTREGVTLIKRQFVESLAALKVTEIDPEGEIFDPEKSEAIATLPTESDENDNKVVQVYKKGYEMNGKILRYAQVVVNKKQ